MGALFSSASGQNTVASTNSPLSEPTSSVLPSADDGSIFNRKNARTIQLKIPAPRGPIIDREGYPLAQNRVVHQLAVQYE
ncbi:MAG: hypothetical protein ACPG4K_10010, partial [Haloferula sp.]